MDYTPEEIKKRFDSLPLDIKTLVYSADMLSLIQKLGQKYKLHVDKLEILESETADVMSGFSKPEEFVKNLKEVLEIDQETAQKISQDINNELFIKIRESLKKLYEKSPTIEQGEAPVKKDLSVVMPSAKSALDIKPPIATPMPVSTVSALPVVAPKPTVPAPTPAMVSPSSEPIAPTSMPAPALVAPAMHGVEAMLSAPTVSMPPKAAADLATPPVASAPAAAATPAAAPKPPAPSAGVSYPKTDPYREPLD